MLNSKALAIALFVFAGGAVVTSIVTSTPPSQNEVANKNKLSNQVKNPERKAQVPNSTSEAYQQDLIRQQTKSTLTAEQKKERQNLRAQIAKNADENTKVIVPAHLKSVTKRNNPIEGLSVEELAKTFGAEIIKKDKVTLLKRNNEYYTEQQVRFMLKRLHSTSTNS